MKHLTGFVLLALLVASLSSVRISEEEFERRIFERTNLLRENQGLAPLIYSDELAYVSRTHSSNMGKQGFFEHEDPQGKQARQRLFSEYPELIVSGAGENLYMSERSDRVFNPEHVVDAWMKSPGHRKNILDKEFTHIGIGTYKTGNKLYSTQVFATPILRMISDPKRRYEKGGTYKLEFEYLSQQPKEGFTCSLATPDPLYKVMVSSFSYYEGLAPVRMIWRDEKLLTLIVDFSQGSGNYSLQAGWGDYYFSELFTFKVQ